MLTIKDVHLGYQNNSIDVRLASEYASEHNNYHHNNKSCVYA